MPKHQGVTAHGITIHAYPVYMTATLFVVLHVTFIRSFEAVMDSHLHASDMSAVLALLHLSVHALTLLLTRAPLQS